MDKHFPRNHKFHNIFNRNNVKVSISNISNHNKTIPNKSETLNKIKCNCINKNARRVNGDYQAKNIIYQASLKSNKLNYDEKYYIGSCETTLKKRFANQKRNHVTTSNVKTKPVFQRKYRILNHQVTLQKLPGKSNEDVPL